MPPATAPGLHDAIAQLARISEPGGRGVTREVFTPEYARARDLVAEWMRAAGLTTRTDAFGNLIGRWDGAEPDAPVVLTGSHIDTTLDAGAYDGVVGVLGAIAAVRRLRDAGAAPRRPIEVIAFAGEEPRFGSGCLGSRALMGELSRDDLDALADRDGVSLAEALRGAGHDPDALADARLDPGRVHAFVELHIEQGAVLEHAGVPIGVVTRIAAPHDLRVTLRGLATHSGATPMPLRRDALAGAAEVMMALEALALGSPSRTTVATVGVLHLEPGAINVVPGAVTLDIDIRDSALEARTAVVDEFQAELAEIARQRRLELGVETLVYDTPTACDERVVGAVRGACERLGVAHHDMVSGAYHDAMILGSHVPIGMIFVPSRAGLSHHPDEHTDAADIDVGVEVLAATLAELTR